MKRRLTCLFIATLAASAASMAHGDDDFDWLVTGDLLVTQPDVPASNAGDSFVPTEPVAAFGEPETWRWGVYGGAASDLESAEHYNLHFTAEYFFARDISVNLELGLFHFDQLDDSWGANFNTLLRWHLLNRDTWTLYADAGAGVLYADTNVPESGTEYNFTPQAGVGATFALGDGGARLMTGVRWHHISNARTQGERNNPGRDSVMGYVGISFPWGN